MLRAIIPGLPHYPTMLIHHRWTCQNIALLGPLPKAQRAAVSDDTNRTILIGIYRLKESA